jgi:two-component system response regulator AtoC
LAAAEKIRPHVVLLDNRLGAEQGTAYIETIHRLDEDIRIIMITAYGTVAQAVESIRRGAYDFVQKPFDLDELHLTIRRGLEELKKDRSLKAVRGKQRELMGISPATEAIRSQIRLLAKNDNVDLLIRGETGTGKEVVVNMIHNASSRKGGPLVKINCSAIPDTLFESELFGYEKGAFTGAGQRKKGLFELADGGTIFLDEIGEMPLAMQAKLLTFLEDRCFKRVGGLSDIFVDVRVMAATNRRLEEETAKGTFREDLFYRLNVMQILIPPLRERVEDIPVIAAYFLRHFNQKFSKEIEDIDPAYLESMCRYHWKGNVRELRNVMEREVLFCEGRLLRGTPLRTSSEVSCVGLKDLREGGIDLEAETAAFQRAYIRRALALCDGNGTAAAQLLGISRFTLKRRMEEEGVQN